jgi:hypothetical protein
VVTLLSLLKDHGPSITVAIAILGFVFSVWQFWLNRRKEVSASEFQNYHKLIRELVQPESESASMWLDRQCAVIYELRFYPKYYPQTIRMLQSLKNKQWGADTRLTAEIEHTIHYIGLNKTAPLRFLYKIWPFKNLDS